MRRRDAVLAILLLTASAAPLHAQLPISVDVSAGPARAGGSGAGAAAFVSLNLLGLHARLGGEVIRTGASASSNEFARIIATSAGVGLIMPGLLIPRPYVLLIGSQGIDWREHDHFRSFGAAVGVRSILSRFSVEGRFERTFQNGVRHVDIPHNVAGVFVGLKVF